MSYRLKGWLSLLFLVIFVSVYLYKSIQSKRNNEYLEKHGVSTIGEIISVNHRKFVYQYIVNESIYSNYINSRATIVPTERYKVLYDKINPLNSIIKMENPVFDTVDYSLIKPYSYRLLKLSEVEFEYRYMNSEYLRVQEIENMDELDTTNLLVLVNKINPRIAYVYFVK